MSSSDPPQPVPLLERLGARFLLVQARTVPAPVAADAVDVLNPAELRGLIQVQTGAARRAFWAGALSGAVSAGAEGLIAPLTPEGAPLWSLASARFWSVVGGATLVASVVEIGFLYWDTLRAVHQLAHVAGLNLSGPAGDQAVVRSLARAALELPNPVKLAIGVDAHRETPKGQLLLLSLAYKAKIGATNFLLKLLLRRLFGRVVVRNLLNVLLPFVAVPVTGLWNAVVSWWTLDEARLRAMGPSAIGAQVARWAQVLPEPSLACRQAMLRAVASAIVRTRDLHPNLLHLLDILRTQWPVDEPAELDDVAAFLAVLPTLQVAERHVVHQVLALACVIDGRISRREHRLWKAARAATQEASDSPGLEAVRRSFMRGDGQLPHALAAL